MKILKSFFSLILFLAFFSTNAQDKLYSKAGKIQFIAKDHPDLEASSRSAVVVIDKKTGELNFSIMVKSFELEKAGMQEKFNNKILETDKFPKAEFKGKLENISNVNFTKDGKYPVAATGKLTMHGVTKDVTANGTVSVKSGIVSVQSEFTVSIANYDISNPGIGDGIITITVDCGLEAIK